MSVRQFSTSVMIFALFLCGRAVCAVSWPASATDWTPLTVGGGVYEDAITAPGFPPVDNYVTPPNPDWLDIVGGFDSVGAGPFAAGFWQKNAEHIMFRIRVDDAPNKNPQNVWQALIDTGGESDADWSVQLDLSGDDQVEWEIALADPPHTGAGLPAGDFYRFVDATAADGSNFQSTKSADHDCFVDFAFPLATFHDTTGLTDAFDFSGKTVLATSATHTLGNKDLPDFIGWNNPEKLPTHQEAPPGAPEPLTILALLSAVGGLASYLRRRGRPS